MVRSRDDLTGQVFGLLVVEGRSHTGDTGRVYWSCRCECGESRAVATSTLKSGHTKSCGCYRRQKLTTHGMRSTSEYSVWSSMIQRCTNTNRKNYPRYGGRGIIVCPEWSSFEQFYKDMGPRPSKEHSIDRIDNDGPYCKENCRWATTQVQTNNRRVNKLLSLDGIVLTVSQWSQRLGVPRSTLQGRLERGWSVSDALSVPVMRKYANDSAR